MQRYWCPCAGAGTDVLCAEARIGNAAAGVNISRIHMDQLSRLQKITDFLIVVFVEKTG